MISNCGPADDIAASLAESNGSTWVVSPKETGQSGNSSPGTDDAPLYNPRRICRRSSGVQG